MEEVVAEGDQEDVLSMMTKKVIGKENVGVGKMEVREVVRIRDGIGGMKMGGVEEVGVVKGVRV